MDNGALGIAFLRDLDEVLVAALKPGRPHLSFGMPDRREVVPLQAVAPHGPVLDQLADCELVLHVLFHCLSPALVVRFQHSPPASADVIANVGIKGPLASIKCQWSLDLTFAFRTRGGCWRMSNPLHWREAQHCPNVPAR